MTPCRKSEYLDSPRMFRVRPESQDLGISLGARIDPELYLEFVLMVSTVE